MLWSREELILTINLYCKLPFGKLHKSNPDVVELAELLKRTPSAVAWKLVNFASFDESLMRRGIRGAQNTSKLDKEIWNEFNNNWEELSFESEKILLEKKDKSIETEYSSYDDQTIEGKDKERLIKTRINQSFFRQTILAAYNYKCCITGIENKSLLIASHIRPWALDELNRLNPRNGLCLNALHDKAYENGLLTITPEYKIKISNLLKSKNVNWTTSYFLKYDGERIILPSRFLPDIKFLEYHYNEKFKK